MRNAILATLVVFGLSAAAFGATTPSTSAAPAAATAQSSSTAKDPKMADCQRQAKEKGLKGAEHKKFVVDCLKAK